MKKVININFQGRVIPIEETAYEILQHYTESLRSFFMNEEGRDEIINDIEGRIAELFSEVLKKGSTCIKDDDVNAVINSIGRPEDFEDDEAKVQSQLSGESKKQSYSGAEQLEAYTTSARRKLYRDENDKILGGVCSGLADYFSIDPTVVRILFVIFFGVTFIPYLILWVAIPSTATQQIGSARKRLMRDRDGKMIGGVCSGLSHYFNVNVWIPRVLFLIPFLSFVFQWHNWGMFNFPHFINLSFSPGATLIYIILWLILPEAKTTSEKLEMKGEKVDLTSIKNTITEEMKGVQERVSKFGKEAATTAKEKGTQFGNEVSCVARRSGRTLGDIILLLFKIFAYFILAVVLIAVVGALFGIGIALTGMLP
ncbi:MAG: PspC domain-containing protein, partial [Parafilimonas sp.]